MASRNLPVDSLRGVACVLLVTMHVIGYDAGSGIHVAPDSAFRWYTDSFVYLRMPLFSVLAGLVYAWRPLDSFGGYSTFMRKKSRRLLVPYLIFVPLIGLSQTLLPGTNNPTGMPAWQWLIYSLSPYWFLLATFWIFAVIALLDSFGLLRNLLSVGIGWLMLIAINIAFPLTQFDFLQLGNALSLAPFFLAGVAFHRFGWQSAPRWVVAALWAATLSLFTYAQAGVLGLAPTVGSRNDFLGICLGTLFPMAVLATQLKSRALAWVGKYSSGIFLLHPFAVAAVRVTLTRLGADNELLLFAAGSAAGLFGSILGIILLRRFPPGRIILGENTQGIAPSNRSRKPDGTNTT